MSRSELTYRSEQHDFFYLHNVYIYIYIYRLYAESRKLRALESRGGPGLSAFERSEDATKGPQGALMHVVSMTRRLTGLELWQRMVTRSFKPNARWRNGDRLRYLWRDCPRLA